MTSERPRPRLEGRDVLADEGASPAEQLGERARYTKLDVISEADSTAAVTAAEQDGWSPGPITILVNNAGIMDPSPIGELSAERWRRTIDVYLTGHFLGIRVNSLPLA